MYHGGSGARGGRQERPEPSKCRSTASAALSPTTACRSARLARRTPASEPKGRPKVVLVLSGGGARGAAHIGVIRKLEEYHVPVDLIVGTSMGSIIGGLYAAGWSIDEIEQRINTTDWSSVFIDRLPRKYRTFRRKTASIRYLQRRRRTFPHRIVLFVYSSRFDPAFARETLAAQDLANATIDGLPVADAFERKSAALAPALRLTAPFCRSARRGARRASPGCSSASAISTAIFSTRPNGRACSRTRS